MPENQRNRKQRLRIESYLDAGHGACWLMREEIARTVEEALLHFDHARYHLCAWCVMPNHVHFVVETLEGWEMAKVLQALKSYTSHKANKILGRSGPFWQREYYDRFIRDGLLFDNVMRYIEENPVKAGLVMKPEDWPWSSAKRRATKNDLPHPNIQMDWLRD